MMYELGEKGSNALDAASDLVDLLRLTHGALHRLKREVHGECFDAADIISKKLLSLREDADKLNTDVTHYIKDIESKKYGG